MADTRTEIGPASVVTGEIEAQEDVVVFGRVEGGVRSTAAVVVEEGGLARANIVAASVVVAGSVIGDIHATERLEITEKGRVLGNVASPRLVLQAGGAVKGQVAMSSRPPEAQPQSRTYSYRQTPGATTRRSSTTPPRKVVREEPPEPQPKEG